MVSWMGECVGVFFWWRGFGFELGGGGGCKSICPPCTDAFIKRQKASEIEIPIKTI